VSRSGIEQLLYMMDSAFDGNQWHSLLKNLGSCRDEDWDWVAPGGYRTIRSLVGELGECKYVYDSHAFGDGSRSWDRPGSVPAPPESGSIPATIEWLKESHAVLRSHLAALLDDSALTEEVMSQWGHKVPRRFLVKTTIEHDLYHCGEINHIRALAQQNDGPSYE
jgi:hypothetical protein